MWSGLKLKILAYRFLKLRFLYAGYYCIYSSLVFTSAGKASLRIVSVEDARLHATVIIPKMKKKIKLSVAVLLLNFACMVCSQRRIYLTFCTCFLFAFCLSSQRILERCEGDFWSETEAAGQS